MLTGAAVAIAAESTSIATRPQNADRAVLVIFLVRRTISRLRVMAIEPATHA